MNSTKQRLKNYCCENCGEQENWIDEGKEGHILERTFFREIYCYNCNNLSQLINKKERRKNEET